MNHISRSHEDLKLTRRGRDIGQQAGSLQARLQAQLVSFSKTPAPNLFSFGAILQSLFERVTEE